MGKGAKKARISIAVPVQHRHRIFRRMVANHDRTPLALTAWAIHLDMDHQLKRYSGTDLHGASIAGMSPVESEVLISWCHHNGAVRVTRTKTFDDFMHSSVRSGIMNLPDDLHDITYMENEMVAIGTQEFVRSLLGFVRRFPQRRHACYVRGISAAGIRRELKQTNHRVVRNMSDADGFIVSCDDRERLFPLWIRG
jgi:hypothetical protein